MGTDRAHVQATKLLHDRRRVVRDALVCRHVLRRREEAATRAPALLGRRDLKRTRLAPAVAWLLGVVRAQVVRKDCQPVLGAGNGMFENDVSAHPLAKDFAQEQASRIPSRLEAVDVTTLSHRRVQVVPDGIDGARARRPPREDRANRTAATAHRGQHLGLAVGGRQNVDDDGLTGVGGVEGDPKLLRAVERAQGSRARPVERNGVCIRPAHGAQRSSQLLGRAAVGEDRLEDDQHAPAGHVALEGLLPKRNQEVLFQVSGDDDQGILRQAGQRGVEVGWRGRTIEGDPPLVEHGRDVIDFQRGVGERVAGHQQQRARAGGRQRRRRHVVDHAVAVVVDAVEHLGRGRGCQADALPVEARGVSQGARKAVARRAGVVGGRHQHVDQPVAVVVDAVAAGLDRLVIGARPAGRARARVLRPRRAHRREQQRDRQPPNQSRSAHPRPYRPVPSTRTQPG